MTVTTEHVWKEYHARLRLFIGKRIGDPSVADDLLQDIFVKIHKNIATLRTDRNLQGWLCRIAHSTIIDYYRTRKPVAELPESLASPENDPTETARQEIMDCLLPMIRNLPEPYREAVMLSEMEGLTQLEVASRQDLSLSGAKSRIQRGRRLLKEMLAECCRFEFDHQGRVTDYEKKSCDRC